MKRVGVAMVVALLVTAGAAHAGGDPVTASVSTSAVFPISPAETAARIEDGCRTRQERVIERSAQVITCAVAMGLAERIAARVWLVEPLASSPCAFLRFSLSPSGADTTSVKVTGSVDDGRPSADRRVRSLTGARFARHVQALLQEAGGTLQSL